MDSSEARTDSGKPRKKRWRRRILALVAGFGLPFLAGEIAVRALQGAPLAERLPIVRIQANPYRGWEMVPSEVHYTYHHAVRVNALGLRGDEVEPKRESERRVLALGDSLIYGQGVGDEDTVPAYLERLLNERSQQGEAGGMYSWDVVNAGHRAYDTRQELGLLEELGEAIDPDVVVLFWYWNDIHERDIDGTNERLSASGPIYFDTGNALEGFDRLSWRAKELARRSALVMALWDIFGARQTQPEDASYTDAAFERLEVYAGSLQELARERGFRLAVAPIPDAGSLLGEHPSDPLLERAVALFGAKGLEVIDLRPTLVALAEETGSLPVIPFDGHYRADANEAIARAVARALVD